MSDSDNLNLAVGELTIDQCVRKSGHQRAADAVYQRPAFWSFENVLNSVANSADEFAPETQALTFVPFSGVLEFRRRGGVKTESLSPTETSIELCEDFVACNWLDSSGINVVNATLYLLFPVATEVTTVQTSGERFDESGTLSLIKL